MKQFRSTAPFFLIKDLQASIDYYHRALGFNRPELWGEPPDFAMPSRDGFIVMLRQATPDMRSSPMARNGVVGTPTHCLPR